MSRHATPVPRRLTAILQRLHGRLRRTSYDYRVLSEWWARQTSRGRRHASPQVPAQASFSIRMGLSPATRPCLLRRAVAAVRMQGCPRWQLCIDIETRPSSALRAALDACGEGDSRVVVRERALADAAWGAPSSCETFVTWLHPHDILAKDALEQAAAAIGREPLVRLLYADEDALGFLGRRVRPRYKPAWSPQLLRSCNPVGRPWFIRSDLWERIGGPPFGCDPDVEYDLLLRAEEQLLPGDVHHVRRVLCHRRSESEPVSVEAGGRARRAVEEHLQRHGIAATVSPIAGWDGFQRVSYAIDSPPPVSIVIPTRDKPHLLGRCLEGLRERTDYPSPEVIIIDNGSVEPATRELLASVAGRADCHVLRDDAPFNFSGLCNRGARAARGTVLCFLNDDMQITDPGWLRELVGLAIQADIGAVSPMLRYPDGRIQHLGIRVDPPWPRLVGDGWSQPLPRHEAALLQVARDVSAVTGGCLVTRRDVFAAVGGFDEALPVASNDVDYCFAVRQAGFRVVVTPFAELRHELGASRRDVHKAERLRDWEESMRYLRRKWPDRMGDDPYQAGADRP